MFITTKNISRAALTLAAAVSLASCSDDMAPDSTGEGRSVWMSIDLSRAATGTDSRLTHAEDANGLDANWEPGDYIYVFDNSGSRYLGQLDWQKEVTNTSTENVATFAGQLNDVNEGSGQTFVLYYVGKSSEGTRRTLDTNHGISIDMSTQAGTFASMAWNDIMSAGPIVDVADGVVTPRAEAINLGHLNSFAHFATNLTAGTKVTISTPNGLTPGFNITPGSGYRFSDADATVTATVQADGHLYVTLPNPGRISNREITFTASNGATATLAAVQLTTGNYYRAGWTTDGGSEGITLEFTGGENPDYPGYENEDPRNPLHKFAKYNLTRTADGEVTNRFVTSETENGALYQWGRNYGFEDNQGVYWNTENNLWTTSTDFINHIEAMGSLTYDDNTVGVFDYYVYEKDLADGYSDGYEFYGLDAGLQYKERLINNRYTSCWDHPKTFNDLETLVSNPTKYFMDATPTQKIMGYGSYGGGLDVQKMNPDYWVASAFGTDNSSKWGERAIKVGYKNGNPCPEHWRMPTLNEMKAILPENYAIGNQVNGSLSNILPQYGVVRYYEGIYYAIRWIDNGDYLTIEAVVVDSSTTDDDLNTLFWDQHTEENGTRVVRKFPYTGTIQPLTAFADGGLVWSSYIARPYHGGTVNYHLFYYTSTIMGGNTTQFTAIDPDEASALFNRYLGGYWVEEKGYVMKFNHQYLKENYLTMTTQRVDFPYLKIDTANPVEAYAIRPVMDI